MQRSSDWLRSGNFSDPAETALTTDLQKLGQQIGDAARALGGAQPASQEAALNRAMDDLSRLRSQLDGLGRDQAGGRQAGGGLGDRIAGEVGNVAGGGRNRGQVYGDLDAGNTRIQGRAVAPYTGPTPADTMRQIDQGVDLLNQVRAAVQDNPEAKQQLQALVEEMRSLDPKRFPGNPALVEQMRQQLLSNVDALELQLRRRLEENQGGTIRNADPIRVPAGYQDSVAEYYRKLSGAGR
jgi:hypothetical protein